MLFTLRVPKYLFSNILGYIIISMDGVQCLDYTVYLFCKKKKTKQEVLMINLNSCNIYLTVNSPLTRLPQNANQLTHITIIIVRLPSFCNILQWVLFNPLPWLTFKFVKGGIRRFTKHFPLYSLNADGKRAFLLSFMFYGATYVPSISFRWDPIIASVSRA